MTELQTLEQKVEALAKKWEIDLAAAWGRVHAWLDAHLGTATSDIKMETAHLEAAAGQDIEKAGAALEPSVKP